MLRAGQYLFWLFGRRRPRELAPNDYRSIASVTYQNQYIAAVGFRCPSSSVLSCR